MQCQIAYMYVLNVRASNNKGAFIYLHQEMAGIVDSTERWWSELNDGVCLSINERLNLNSWSLPILVEDKRTRP